MNTNDNNDKIEMLATDHPFPWQTQLPSIPQMIAEQGQQQSIGEKRTKKCHDTIEIAKRHEFNLTIPKEDEQPQKKFRLNKKSFAITCVTNMTWENIMKHIENEFGGIVQYVCIASRNDSQTHYPMVYIQIILQKTVNKKTYFLKAVAGMRCNYQVTCNDRAWNAFLRKDGNYVEIGKFQSVRSRVGTKWSEAMRQKHKEKREKSKIKHIQIQTIESQQTAEKVVTGIMAEATESIEKAIDLIRKDKYQLNININRTDFARD